MFRSPNKDMDQIVLSQRRNVCVRLKSAVVAISQHLVHDAHDNSHDELSSPPSMSSTPSSPVSPLFNPNRPKRPTRSIPPLPTLVTGSDEPLANDDGDDDEDVFSSPQEQPPSPDAPQPAVDLTPIRAHYLKKSLVQLQFRYEIDAITTHSPTNTNTLSFLGPPFSPPPRDANPYLDLPFLRYIFRQFVLTFPFMATAPKNFYSDKLQPFVSSALSRNLSPTSVLDDDDKGDGTSEQATRKKLMARVERNLAMFVGAATKLVEPEQIVRLHQSDLDRLEALAKKRMAKVSKTKIVFEVNVIGVKTVVDKGRMRSRVHEEFIVRTRRSNYADVLVSRRYGDFRTLAHELQKAHPNEQIRPPPAKDRTAVVSAPSPSPNASWDDDPYGDIPQSPSQTGLATSRLAREKNRLTLRSYLHSLLSSSVASSPVLRSFLLSGPVNLTQAELEDAQRREEADHVREDGRKRFAKEIASRVEGLREAVKSVKGDVMGKDGLTHIFATIKVTPNVNGLPANYRAVLEWARISMFTSSLTEEVKALEAEIEAVKDKVDDLVMSAKIRQFVYAPREIQDMYKADAAAEGMNLLTVVLRAPDEPVLSRGQMHRLAKAHRAHHAYMKHRATLADSDDDDGPQNEDAWLLEDLKMLTHLYSKLRDREQLIALIFEVRAFLVPGLHRRSPQGHHYDILYATSASIPSRQGFTADLLKDIITIFYTPLAQVYRAASIADSLGDLQNFINDLIKTVECVEELSQEDPHRTVQAFIDLIQRHEQSFYLFVHKVHSKGENLFDGLMKWIELFLTVVREGLGPVLSLEFLLPHAGKAREDIIAEVDKVALYHYKLKVAYEAKLRRRFGRIQERGGDADVEDLATQELVNGVVGEIDFGELIQGGVDDLAAEETDDDSSDEGEDDDSSEYESGESGSTSSEEESSEDDAPPPRDVPPRRSNTLNIQRTPPPPDPEPTPRKRTLSLKSTASLLKRRSADLPPVPPRPNSVTADLASKPLPGTTTSRSFNEVPHTPTTPSKLSFDSSNKFSRGLLPQGGHLPHEAPPRRSHDVSSRNTFDSSSRHSGSSTQSHDSPPRPKKKKKAAQVLHPPNLEHIPQLLPVFVEMMRPLLQPRQQQGNNTAPASRSR
ncbi:hypothetical protein DXG03_004675 [Asterophora parasitica]|uniref:PX domain-containing protein n=1 Tax=Asterophora parasitica TaxID=117018 RepID=A0A9P7G6W3_9AGAR|nr:hypothetical protein DXG03_004675 [Asterophora parasitica]